MPTLSAPLQQHEPIALGVDLVSEINRLRHELNAVILAHFYQCPQIQDIADCRGDSLRLAQFAASTQADVIVFAGVHFMGEMAKILNPDRLVLMPDLDAGCSLADECDADKLEAFKMANPNYLVVAYINCSAEVKALSDVIVTSANAEKIVHKMPSDRPILFVPDKNLGAYVSRVTGRKMTLWDGACIVHELFDSEKLNALKQQYPQALVLAHPECESQILELADHIGSTASMLEIIGRLSASTFIIATDAAMLYAIRNQYPQKEFLSAPARHVVECNFCPHMQRNTLENLYLCMRDQRPELTLDPVLIKQARRPLERMLELSAS